MRNISPLAVGGLIALCLLAGPAQAAIHEVHFRDGFETQTDPLGPPPTGVSWNDNGVGDNHALVTSPVAGGTKALQVIRNGATQVPLLTGVGTAGALVPSTSTFVQYIFHINQVADGATTHNFNSPIQLKVGFSNGVALATVGTLDGGSENYFVSNGGGANPNVNTGITVPRNTAAYDRIRLLLTLTQPAAGQLGGTYQVFISTDGGAETQVGTTFNLTTQTIPGFQPTNPAFQIQRGPSTSTSLYDDISIQIVPEPSIIAMCSAMFGLLFMRRRCN